MNSKTALYITFGIIAVIILPVIIVTCCNWEAVKPAFFGYTLVDILNLLVTILIGICITVYLSMRANNHSKKAEIISGNIDSAIEINKNIIENLRRCYKKSMSAEEKKNFNIAFKCASIELSNCEEYLRQFFPRDADVERNVNEIKYLGFSLKKTITDAPFSLGHLVSDEDISKANKEYYEIKSRFQKIKMLLYK